MINQIVPPDRLRRTKAEPLWHPARPSILRQGAREPETFRVEHGDQGRGFRSHTRRKRSVSSSMDQAAAQGQGDHRQAHRGEPHHPSSPPPGFLETVTALPITVPLHPWTMGFTWCFWILAYFIATLPWKKMGRWIEDSEAASMMVCS
jgi:hypothetical protein